MEKFKKFTQKIFGLDTKRALEILSMLDNLSENGLLNLKNAKKVGISEDEWEMTQMFYLCPSVNNLEIIRNELKSRLLVVNRIL